MNLDYIWILKSIPAVILGLTIHEYAHAFAAYRLGDTTAKDQGRLTLNPIKHIDPLGFILIVIAGFGWAKPVMFSPQNLKREHRDEIIISLAGPVSNLVLAILFLVVARFFYLFPYFNSADAGLGFVNLLVTWAIINLGLFVFNLIPIPPLDGSHVYTTFMKQINPNLLRRMYQFGTWGLLIIILIQNNSDIVLLPLSSLTQNIAKFFISALGFN